MALNWAKPKRAHKYTPFDIIIRSNASKKTGKRAIISISKEKAEELGWDRVVVAFDGKNRIYIKQDPQGFKLTTCKPGSNIRPQVFVGDAKLASIFEVKRGGYMLKYDNVERCRYIDLEEHEN